MLQRAIVASRIVVAIVQLPICQKQGGAAEMRRAWCGVQSVVAKVRNAICPSRKAAAEVRSPISFRDFASQNCKKKSQP